MKLSKKDAAELRKIVNRLWQHADVHPIQFSEAAKPPVGRRDIEVFVNSALRQKLRYHAAQLNELLEPDERVKL